MRLRKKTIERILWILSAIMLALGLYYSYRDISFKSKLEQKVQTEIKKNVSEELKIIEKALTEIKETAASLAKKLGTEKIGKGDVEKLLKESLEKNKNLVGAGAAFEPSVIDEKTKLFAPYFQVEDKKIISTPITYDYTQPSKGKFKPDINWYTNPLSQGEVWAEPHYDTKKRAVIGEYAVAIYKENATSSINGTNKKVLGIVFVNFNLNTIKNLVSYFNLGKTGYGLMLSKKGTIISHYKDEYVSEQKTIADLEKESKNESLVYLGKQMLSDKKVLPSTAEVINYTDQVSTEVKKDSWAFLSKISPADWRFAAIYYKNEVFVKHVKTIKQNKILVVITLLFFLLFMITALGYRYAANKNILILCSTIISLLLITGISITCKLGFDEGLELDQNKSIITSEYDMQTFFKSKKGQINAENLVYIPTGVIINHIEFLDIDSVHFSGYLWQKYPTETKDENIPRFSVEKAVSSNIEIKKIYIQNDKKIAEMNFKCVLPVVTQYGKYPFDYQQIRLKLTSKDRTGNFVLIPDFEGYSIITPGSLPGLSKRISLKGWNLQKSFFAYEKQSYEVTYGLNEKTIKNIPILSYNVVIKRRIVQPLLSIILPLLIILFLIFILLLVADRLNMVTLFSANSALILSIIFSHVSLRDKLPISGIFYLEYFYLASYLLIVLASLSVFYRFKSKRKIPFLRYKENLLSKLLFWPVTFLTIFLLTVHVFYG